MKSVVTKGGALTYPSTGQTYEIMKISVPQVGHHHN